MAIGARERARAPSAQCCAARTAAAVEPRLDARVVPYRSRARTTPTSAVVWCGVWLDEKHWHRLITDGRRAARGADARGRLVARSSPAADGRVVPCVWRSGVFRRSVRAARCARQGQMRITQVAAQPGILAPCESITLFTSASSKSWPPRPSLACLAAPSAGWCDTWLLDGSGPTCLQFSGAHVHV